MAIFLTAPQAYRLMQRELPEGTYADGIPSGNFTTASIYAKAQLVDDAYANLSRIYGNMFPQSADEKITDWEVKAFGTFLPDGMTLADRQAAVVNKLRQRPGINRAAIVAMVRTVVGPDQQFFVVDWGCTDDPDDGTGSWQLDDSQLDIDTFLAGGRGARLIPSSFPNANFCINDPAFGITDKEYLAIRETAYTYEIKFYGFTLSADQRASLDAALTKGEPARSAHVITDGLDPADMPGGDT